MSLVLERGLCSNRSYAQVDFIELLNLKMLVTFRKKVAHEMLLTISPFVSFNSQNARPNAFLRQTFFVELKIKVLYRKCRKHIFDIEVDQKANPSDRLDFFLCSSFGDITSSHDPNAHQC